MSIAKRINLAAKWVLPVSDLPLENGVVIINAGQIEAVLSRNQFEIAYEAEDLIDYGEAVITPGLINLHTHIDYTALRLFDTNSRLFDWIQGLAGLSALWTPKQWRDSALSGATEIALSGTTCIADCSYSGAAAWASSMIGLRAIVGLEIFGIDDSTIEQKWNTWLTRLHGLLDSPEFEVKEALSTGRVRLTVSPHAPYSVCPALWKIAHDWAAKNGLPIFTHLCESAEEVDWISSGSSTIDRFLQAMMPGGLPNPESLSWKATGQSPVELLASNGLLGTRTIAAHAVNLQSTDISLLSQTGCAVAHCPRSNARLRVGRAPLEQLLQSGVRVGFGTDSAASTDDLSILNEARFGVTMHRAVAPSFAAPSDQIFRMLTLGAAEILGAANEIGSLEPGKSADLAVFKIGRNATAASSRPYDLLVYGQCRLRDLFVEGKKVVHSGIVKRSNPTSHNSAQDDLQLAPVMKFHYPNVKGLV